MRILNAPIPLLLIACFASCDKKSVTSAPVEMKLFDHRDADIPILPVKKGDFWKYRVKVEIPAGIASEGAAAVDIEQEKSRRYVGKVNAGKDRPEVDAFDVESPGVPVERELVEILEDRILMRGSTRPDMPDAQPIWMDPPVPFVVAGVRPGQVVAEFGVQDGARKRGIKVVARESVKVPMGEYAAIRLLMTGNDGRFDVRRTTWFVPGIGIVKEEKTRYADGKLLFRETSELIGTSMKLATGE